MNRLKMNRLHYPTFFVDNVYFRFDAADKEEDFDDAVKKVKGE